MIPEARQIDDLVEPAWHKLSNYQEPDLAQWQTEVLFGGKNTSCRCGRRSGRPSLRTRDRGPG